MLDDIVECLSSSKGATIIGIDVVVSCQILRVDFDDGISLELSGGWIYGISRKIVLGAMDIGFYFGSEEDLLAVMDEDEKRFKSKLAGLKGLKLNAIEHSEHWLTLDLAKSRHIKWFCLSSEQHGIRVLSNA